MESIYYDAIKNILYFLSAREIFNLCETSKYYNNICNIPIFWQFLFNRDFPGVSHSDDYRQSYINIYESLRPLDLYIDSINNGNIDWNESIPYDYIVTQVNLKVKRSIYAIILSNKNIYPLVYIYVVNENITNIYFNKANLYGLPLIKIDNDNGKIGNVNVITDSETATKFNQLIYKLDKIHSLLILPAINNKQLLYYELTLPNGKKMDQKSIRDIYWGFLEQYCQ